MTDDASYEYTVYGADDQGFVFTGRLIGEASSQGEVPRNRWTVVKVYVTDAGAYVVHTVGMSRMPGEKARGRVQVSEAPAGAVEALHQIDDDGIRYLTKVARAAATQAAEHDEGFRAAFALQRVA